MLSVTFQDPSERPAEVTEAPESYAGQHAFSGRLRPSWALQHLEAMVQAQPDGMFVQVTQRGERVHVEGNFEEPEVNSELWLTLLTAWYALEDKK